MYYHMCAFGLFTLAELLLIMVLQKKKILHAWTGSNRGEHQEQLTKLTLSTEAIVISLIAVSEIPIIHILSTLVSKGIEEAE